jgi:A/G-specific adenine glycosylase
VILADFALLQTDEPPQLPPDYIWVEENDLDNYGVPRLVERLFRAVHLYDEEPD